MGGRWGGWGVYVSCFPSLPTFTVKSKEQHLFYIVKNKTKQKTSFNAMVYFSDQVKKITENFMCIWSFSGLANLLLFSQIMRDPETGNSKGYAFVNFASFDASDAAIEAMNGQYLCNRAITISYAFKKESKGERHGSAAGTIWGNLFLQ